ncbi:MAG: glycosyltransferase family 9 protein [Luteolibacter sp.]
MKSKILIYRFGQLGDTIAAIPAIEAIRQHFPGREIVLLSETVTHETHLGPALVLGETGLVDSFATYPAVGSARGALAALSKLRSLASDGAEALIYLVPSIRPRSRRLRDLMVFRLAGFSNILGAGGFPDEITPRQADGSLSYVEHETDALLRRLAKDGMLVPPSGKARIDLRLQPAEREVAERWLSERGLESGTGRQWFAICPGSKWASKLWPTHHYAELGLRLSRDLGWTPVVVGGKEDQLLAGDLLAHWGSGFCAAGQMGVRESAALMEQAGFYVGNDTGAMHLAAAVATPCVGIFSAQDWPGRWNPYGEIHRVLRTQVECAGCMSAECPNDVLCLRQISVETAYQACREIAMGAKGHRGGE